MITFTYSNPSIASSQTDVEPCDQKPTRFWDLIFFKDLKLGQIYLIYALTLWPATPIFISQSLRMMSVFIVAELTSIAQFPLQTNVQNFYLAGSLKGELLEFMYNNVRPITSLFPIMWPFYVYRFF